MKSILQYLRRVKWDDYINWSAVCGYCLIVCVALVPKVVRSYYRQGTRREWLCDPIDNRDTTVFKPYSKPIIQQIALN